MDRPHRILILGYYGFSNLGDEIVLAGILSGIRQTADGMPYEVRALSASPANTSEVHGLRSYPRFSPTSLVWALRWSQTLVLGGGSLLQDSTSRRSALYYLWMIRLALLMRRKVYLWSQGFGPLDDAGLRSLAGRLLRRVDAISVRDPLSLNEFRALGVREDSVFLSADPAFLVNPADTLREEEFFNAADTEGGLLGISLRPWPSLERSESELSAALHAFLKESAALPLYLPFHQPQDVEISNKMSALTGLDSAVLQARPSPPEMVRLFQELTIVLGMRLHSLILAAKAGRPFVGVSYDPKVERFCSSAGMPSLTLDGVHQGELLDLLLEVHDNRQSASEHLRDFAREQSGLALQSGHAFWRAATGA